MSLLGSRELSQFGSFLYIDDTTRKVGIATTSSPFVGFGTANPAYKVHVVGNANVDGDLYIKGALVADAVTERWSGSGLDIYRLNGNVGVGTSLSLYKLHVVGDANVDGTLYSDSLSISNSLSISAGNTSSINLRSGGVFNYTSLSIGRNGAEGTLSVSGGTGQFSSNSVAGDIILRTETTSSRLLFNNGSNNAALALNQNNVIIGGVTPTGTTSQPLQVSGSAYVSTVLGIGNTLTSTAGAGQILGGFGANATTGTVDWNHSSNARSGNGFTLLLGNATNGPGAAYPYYYHPFAFEYTSKNGTGNLTQLGIPYGNVDQSLASGIIYRSKFNGAWNTWHRTVSQPAGITGVNITSTGNLGVNVTNATSRLQVEGDARIVGVITANKFSGSGIGLTGVVSFIGIRSETGGSIGVGASILRFVGTAVSTITVSSGIATISLFTSPGINTSIFIAKNGDAMNGTLGVALGSVSLPSVYFNGFPSTGLYAPGANRLGVSCNGALILDVTTTGISVSGDINSTSDINLKKDIQEIESPLNIVNNLHGIKFTWKESDRKSVGVIAQELEEVLPELVSGVDKKTVNYNGLIGVLIEAIKELKKEVDDLKGQLNN